MLDREEVVHELHAGILREWASGFEQLHRIPSTDVRKFIDYLAGLDAAGKESLAAALADGAHESLYRDSNKPPLYKRNDAYRKYVDTKLDMRGERYAPVRALRGPSVLAQAEAASGQRPPGRPRMAYAKPSRLLAAAKVKRILSIQPVTSVDVRKQVKQALSKVVSPLSVKHEPAHLWEYSGEMQGVPLVVSINYFSPLYAQLEYWVSMRGERTGLWGSSFERLMGLNSANWDLLEGANLEQSIAVLCDHIAYCGAFLWRLPKCHQQTGQASDGRSSGTAEDA